MNVIRKLVLYLSAVALAIAASPGIAAVSKAYSLTMSASPHYTVSADGQTTSVIAPVQVTAQIRNESPPSDASSNISSFQLTLAVPGVTIYSDDTHQPFGTIDGATQNGTITITGPTAIQVTALGPLKGKQTYTLTFYVTSCGDAKWDAAAFTGSQLTGTRFNRVNDAANGANLMTNINCGTIACGEQFSVADTTQEATSNPLLVGMHGGYNKDGTCGALGYFVSNMLLTSKQVHFRWPVSGTGAQPRAVFSYELFNVPNPPNVAWKNVDGTLATHGDGSDQPVYITAPTCMSDQLPAPYGSLNQPVNATSTQLKVNTSPSQGAVLATPTVFPFVIVVGSERMEVQSIQGSTWTVLRAQGNTQGSNHSGGALVMSTPLPVLTSTAPSTLADGVTVISPSPYNVGDQAQMCVVTTDTANPTIIDIGDGWVLGR